MTGNTPKFSLAYVQDGEISRLYQESRAGVLSNLWTRNGQLVPEVP